MFLRIFIRTIFVLTISGEVFCQEIIDSTLYGEYFSFVKPENFPVGFAHNIISNEFNSGICSFSPDGKWCFFNHRTSRCGFTIYFMRQSDNGLWAMSQVFKYS